MVRSSEALSKVQTTGRIYARVSGACTRAMGQGEARVGASKHGFFLATEEALREYE
jgi:hypothetical protein